MHSAVSGQFEESVGRRYSPDDIDSCHSQLGSNSRMHQLNEYELTAAHDISRATGT